MLSFIFLFTHFSFFSQNKTEKKYTIQSFNFQTIFTNNFGNSEFFRSKEFNNSTYLLTTPLSTTLMPGTFSVFVKPQYSINLDLGLKSSKKSKSTLRIGLNNFSEIILANNYISQETFHYDTVSINNETYFLDSITTKLSDVYYSSQQIRLNMSYLFRINSDKRWSYFAGLGLSVGMSFKATTNINSITSVATASSFGSDYYVYPNVINTSEKVENKTNYGFIISSPIGVDFRIGKINKYWSQIHLFYEIKPSYNFVTIASFGSLTNLNIQQGVGVRYVLR